jgi:glyoxylase-like metal-dependent hydrolase (beta-lactamase superfamily II)
VVDPGPDREPHVRAVLREVADADAATLVVSHGHGDHAGAVTALAEGLEAHGVPYRVLGSGHPLAELPREGEPIETDAGALEPLSTPGHVPDHLAFHWSERSALFVGDLLLGEGETTWVAGYPGCVSDYLDSLRRVGGLAPAVIFPAHGPPLLDPARAVDRFEAHRRDRIAQVRGVLSEHPRAGEDEIVERVYGDRVPPELRRAALESVRALLDHVRENRNA